jgi:hypothetical protein
MTVNSTHPHARTAQVARVLAQHLRQAHGWTVLDAEETDLYALRAMHRVAYENSRTSPKHGK